MITEFQRQKQAHQSEKDKFKVCLGTPQNDVTWNGIAKVFKISFLNKTKSFSRRHCQIFLPKSVHIGEPMHEESTNIKIFRDFRLNIFFALFYSISDVLALLVS